MQNSNQESSIPSLNISIEHRKRTNQKRVENAVNSDLVEPNAINFVKITLKQHHKELIKFEFRTVSNDCEKEPIREEFRTKQDKYRN